MNKMMLSSCPTPKVTVVIGDYYRDGDWFNPMGHPESESWRPSG
jgi:hypothetical protein